MKIETEDQSEYIMIQELKDCKRTTRCLFAARDLLISGNFDNKVNIYKLALTSKDDEPSESGVILPQFQLAKTFDIFDSFVYSVAYAPEKSLLAVGCKSGSIYLIGLESDFMQIISDAHAKRVCSLSFHIEDSEGT